MLVPFKENGIIDVVKEKKLAKIRVQTLSILLCKDGQDFIEDDVPVKICYELQNSDTYCKKIMDSKTRALKKYKPNKISNKDFDILKNCVDNYWDSYFNQNFLSFALKDFCLAYLKYKTLKAFVNYEIITKQIDFDLQGLYDSVHMFRFSSRLIVDLFLPSTFEILLIESPFVIPHSMISRSIVLRCL